MFLTVCKVLVTYFHTSDSAQGSVPPWNHLLLRLLCSMLRLNILPTTSLPRRGSLGVCGASVCMSRRVLCGRRATMVGISQSESASTYVAIRDTICMHNLICLFATGQRINDSDAVFPGCMHCDQRTRVCKYGSNRTSRQLGYPPLHLSLVSTVSHTRRCLKVLENK